MPKGDSNKVWEFETTQSELLYLCLEASFARTQSRLFEITDEAPPTLHLPVWAMPSVTAWKNKLKILSKITSTQAWL